jgi:hypothetical protein
MSVGNQKGFRIRFSSNEYQEATRQSNQSSDLGNQYDKSLGYTPLLIEVSISRQSDIS